MRVFGRAFGQIFGLLALMTLGSFGFQTLALPIHDVQHSVQHLQESNDSGPALSTGQCELCFAYHSNAADAFTPPAADYVATPIAFSGAMPSAQVPSVFHLTPEARGPPSLG